MVDNSIKLTSFKTISLGSYSGSTSMDHHTSYILHLTSFKTIWRRKRTVKMTLGFISGPSKRNKEDTGQRTQGQLHQSSSFAL